MKFEIRKILGIMELDAKGAPVHLLEKNSASTPFETLIGTMLSARTKDTTTARILPSLFDRTKTPDQMLKLSNRKLEKIIYGIGFYKTKSKRIHEISKILISEYDGKVPSTIEGLLGLPGVGRKTANIVLARVFGKDTIGVDVHVHRISNRLGLVKTKKPEETEKKLMVLVPANYRRKLNKIFVAYGQVICLPKKPLCGKCKLNRICPKIGIKTS
ncbi:MAG: endonuclease III [Candidatus Micrarchaeota archaeon]